MSITGRSYCKRMLRRIAVPEFEDGPSKESDDMQRRVTMVFPSQMSITEQR